MKWQFVGGGVLLIAVVAAVLWFLRGRERDSADGVGLPAPQVVAGERGASAPQPAAPAGRPAQPRGVPGGEPAGAQRPGFRRAARIATVGARLRRRRDPTPAELLLADPALPGLGARALELAGRDEHWWPYAALVGADSVTVCIAGLEVPEPLSPWTKGEDSRSWVLSRSRLEAAGEHSGSSGHRTAGAGAVCPAVLGGYGDAAVVIDAGCAHGTLLFSGDPVQAERVRASLAEQLEGGELLVGAAPPNPHWELPVDARGTVLLHGLPVVFAPLPEYPAYPADPAPLPRVREPAGVQEPAPMQAPLPAPAPDPVPRPGPAPAPAVREEPDEWEDIAVSSA